jgi:hypothetical protein
LTDAVKELVAAAEECASRRYEPRLSKAVEAVKAEEKPHPFRSFYVTPARALMGPCAVAFCGQPADAPIHQTGGKL